MSRMTIEYKRFSKGWTDKVRTYSYKLWKRLMGEVDIEEMEYEDIQLLRETSRMYKDVLAEAEDQIDVMNYQVRLLEDMTCEIRDMNDRLKRLEARK